MRGHQIREKLRNGERVYGTHIASLMNPNATAMSAEMELDFAFFCTEHMPIDRTEVSLLCHFYASRGISPMVRVPSSDPTGIATALDGGAEGIVVPYVETVEEVRRAGGAVRYRPLKGELLRQVLEYGHSLPTKTTSFLDDFNRSNYLIIGIESMSAVENLEELLEASDADGVFLGPHDISASMGIPGEYENPLFVNLIEDVIRRCRKCSVGAGLHTQLLNLNPPVLRRYLAAGMNFILNASDIVIMREAMNTQLRKLRNIVNEHEIPRDVQPSLTAAGLS